MSILGFLFNCDEKDVTKPELSYLEEYDYLKQCKVRCYLFDLSICYCREFFIFIINCIGLSSIICFLILYI